MKKKTTRLLAFIVLMSLWLSPAVATTVAIPVNSSSVPASEPDRTKVEQAFKEFKSLSRSERKKRIKESRKLIKQYKADKKAGKTTDDRTILLVILAILIPPLAIYLKEDAITWKFWVCLALIIVGIFTTLFLLGAAVIFALLVVFDVIQ